MVELGELAESGSDALRDQIQVIKDSGDVTIFKSVGLGVQDVMIGRLVLEVAERLNLGTIVSDYD